MTGKSHVITGVCTGLMTVGGVMYENTMKNVTPFLDKGLDTITQYVMDTTIDMRLYVPLAIILYLIGCLLPDIDQPNSMLGRFIHIPIKHRTWTHTLWFILLFFIPSIWLRPFIWLCFGVIVHILFDSISSGGVCLLYPISKYQYYDNGAMVKKGHVIKLYRVGKVSEYVLLTVYVILTLGLMWLYYQRIHP